VKRLHLQLPIRIPVFSFKFSKEEKLEKLNESTASDESLQLHSIHCCSVAMGNLKQKTGERRKVRIGLDVR